LNKQSRTTKKGCLAWGLGVGLTTPRRKNINVLRNVSELLAPGLILWHELSNWKLTFGP